MRTILVAVRKWQRTDPHYSVDLRLQAIHSVWWQLLTVCVRLLSLNACCILVVPCSLHSSFQRLVPQSGNTQHWHSHTNTHNNQTIKLKTVERHLSQLERRAYKCHRYGDRKQQSEWGDPVGGRASTLVVVPAMFLQPEQLCKCYALRH
jgi:hypothetical protein